MRRFLAVLFVSGAAWLCEATPAAALRAEVECQNGALLLRLVASEFPIRVTADPGLDFTLPAPSETGGIFFLILPLPGSSYTNLTLTVLDSGEQLALGDVQCGAAVAIPTLPPASLAALGAAIAVAGLLVLRRRGPF